MKGDNKAWKFGLPVLVQGWSLLPAHHCRFSPVPLLSVRYRWEIRALHGNPAVWRDAELCLRCNVCVTEDKPVHTQAWTLGCAVLRQSKTTSEQGLMELEVCCSLPTWISELETRDDSRSGWKPPILQGENILWILRGLCKLPHLSSRCNLSQMKELPGKLS